MTLLILGLILWSAAHMFKRLAPAAHTALLDRVGNPAKGVIAVLLVASVVLMVIGFRGADTSVIWDRTIATTGINNLMMLGAVGLMGLGNSKSRLRPLMRHPMLWGVVVWAAAHLLVNGDTVSIVLFGWMAVWALAEMVLINRADPEYTPFQGGTAAGDVRLAVITVVVFAVIAGIHTWLGYYPFA